MICEGCAKAISESDKFCSGCGLAAPAYIPCPYCAEPIRAAARLCRYCQSEIHFDAQRISVPTSNDRTGVGQQKEGAVAQNTGSIADTSDAERNPEPPNKPIQESPIPLNHESPSSTPKPHSTAKGTHRGAFVCLGIAAAFMLVGLPVGGLIFFNSLMEVSKEKAKQSPLSMAVAANKIEVVDALLAAKADPNETFIMGHTPLIHCARTNSVAIAEHLLKAGADPNKKDTIGWAPLHHAVKTDRAHSDMILLLARYKADLNVTDSSGRTPLHRAVQYRHSDAVALLLKLGADRNAKDNSGQTPLDRAQPYPEIVEILEKGR